MLYWTDINWYTAAEGKGTFCYVQARLNQHRVKETSVLVHLQELLFCEGKHEGKYAKPASVTRV